MIRTRLFASFGAATAVVGTSLLSGILAAPLANADTLDDIRGFVNATRAQSTCPALNYSTALEGEAQHSAGNKLPGVPPTGNYQGTFAVFPGTDDQAGHATLRAGERADSGLKDCGYKDFGVGFVRSGDGDFADTVVIVLGKPTAAQPAAAQPVPVAAPPVPVAAPPINCSDGSTVPAGQTCPVEAPPTNAVTLSFTPAGLNEVATFTNSSKVSGQCHYNAEDANGLLPGKTDDFPIGAKATVTRTYPSPPLLSTYHATVVCHGNFNGQDVEFGNTSTDVSR